MKTLPSVVIVGRVNVGKSALFNRLTESQRANVSDIAGTTRDYNIAPVEWHGRIFNLIDTGGISAKALEQCIEQATTRKPVTKKNTQEIQPDVIEQKIIEQTQRALEQASLVVLVVDVQSGIMPEDREIARMVQRLRRPTLLAVNKADAPKWRDQVAEFYSLGLGEPHAISASNGSGTGDLLDAVITHVKAGTTRDVAPPPRPMRIAIMGRPNVGKSSLVNAIVGHERVIVSPIANTTREPQDTDIVYNDQPITLIDTAGLRRKSRVIAFLERLSNAKAIETIRRADVVLLVLDATERVTSQDMRLAELLNAAQVGVLIVANKWDLIPDKDTSSADVLSKYYRNVMPHLRWAPIMVTSTATAHNINDILPHAIAIWQERQRVVPADGLRSIIARATAKHKPAKAEGQFHPAIQSFVQTRSNPPEFTITIGFRQSLHFSYLRFVENMLRQEYGFNGVPIVIHVFAQPKRIPKHSS